MSSFCWLPIQVPPECSVMYCVHAGYWLCTCGLQVDVAAVAVPGDAAEERVVAQRGVGQRDRAEVVVVAPVAVEDQHLGGDARRRGTPGTGGSW